MSINVELIKKLRDETGAGVLEVKEALTAAEGDYEKAKAALVKKGLAKAEKKAERVTKDGLVHAYIHAGGKVGSLVFIACETDFVAKTDDFKTLCNEVALQVCTEDYVEIRDLLDAEYIRDGSKKIKDLVKETIAKLGENIEIKEFARFSVR